jgi:autotransporter passenger strand-loop-strand repeat protein
VRRSRPAASPAATPCSGSYRASAAVVYGGGQLLVTPGGLAAGDTLSGGSATIYGGGSATDLVLAAGAFAQVASGGVASGASVGNGALLNDGGVLVSTVISAGGSAQILSPGVASGTTVLSGGTETVAAGGTTSATTVLSGGTEQVLSGGTASNVTVASGGVLADGGTVDISVGKVLAGSLSGVGVIAETGSATLVLSGPGSGFSGQAQIGGGATIELAGVQAIGTGVAVFEGGTGAETLRIDAADAPAAGGTFANLVSNFAATNDAIDLTGLAFVAGASATANGSTLTLSDGGQNYLFSLAGSIGSSFAVSSDGHGGTLIDPRVAGFVQSLAGFSPPSAAIAAPVSAGGTSGFAEMLHATASAGAR